MLHKAAKAGDVAGGGVIVGGHGYRFADLHLTNF
jgi:hypothetical protein